MDAGAIQTLAAVVVAVIRAMVVIHEFMRHQRLIRDVRMTHVRWHGPRRHIQLRPQARTARPGVIVVEKVRLTVEAILALAIGAGSAAQARPFPISDVGWISVVVDPVGIATGIG